MKSIEAIEAISWFVLKCDVFLSADTFEEFRNKCMKNYALCFMLKMTNVELESVSYVDIYVDKERYADEEWEVVFHTFLKDIIKLTIKIYQHMIPLHHLDILHI